MSAFGGAEIDTFNLACWVHDMEWTGQRSLGASLQPAFALEGPKYSWLT